MLSNIANYTLGLGRKYFHKLSNMHVPITFSVQISETNKQMFLGTKWFFQPIKEICTNGIES